MVVMNTDLRAYQRVMDLIDKTLFPRTVARTLNDVADNVTNGAKKNVQQRMIVRTTFTTNSIRTDRRARGTNLRTMHSRSVSLSPYLATQETGGNIRARNRAHPIPTIKARTGRNQKKSIATRYRMNRLGTIKQNPQFFIGRSPRSGTLGLWERYQNNKRIRLIRRLEHSTITLKAKHWHRDAVRLFASQRNITKIFTHHAKQGLPNA